MSLTKRHRKGSHRTVFSNESLFSHWFMINKEEFVEVVIRVEKFNSEVGCETVFSDEL